MSEKEDELTLAQVMHFTAPLKPIELTHVENLQVLMMEEERRPTIYGVLYVKVKEARNLINPKLEQGLESLYCKVSVRNQTKRTSVVQLAMGSCEWNQSKHLPTTVVRSRKHPFNLVRLQVVAFDSYSSKPHVTIGSVAFHLHDIIKVSKVSGTFDIFDDHVFVGEMDLDISFTYGLFGYGYSAQLKEENQARSVEEHLQYSLFPRIPPPVDRAEWDRLCLAPRAVPHPPFLTLKEVVPLSYAREIAPLLESIDENTHQEFVSKYMGRFTELREEMKGIKDRHKRLHFLHQVISSSSRKQEAVKTQIRGLHLDFVFAPQPCSISRILPISSLHSLNGLECALLGSNFPPEQLSCSNSVQPHHIAITAEGNLSAYFANYEPDKMPYFYRIVDDTSLVKKGLVNPISRYCHSAAVIGDAMYLYGGSHDGVVLSDIYRFDSVSRAWEKLTNSSPSRLPALFGHTCSVVNGQMIVFGGQTERGDFSRLTFRITVIGKEVGFYEFHEQIFAPVARLGHTSSVIGSRMYIFGGKSVDGHLLSDLCCFDLEGNMWREQTQKGSLPKPRAWHAAAAVGNRIYIYGGHGDEGELGDFYFYDSETGIWSALPLKGEIPPPLHSAVLLTLSPRFLALCGGHTGTPVSDWYLYDVEEGRWTKSVLPPSLVRSTRYGHTCVVHGSSISVFGGRNRLAIADHQLVQLVVSTDSLSPIRRPMMPLPVSPSNPEGKNGLFPFGDTGVLDYEMWVLRQQTTMPWLKFDSSSGSSVSSSPYSPQSYDALEAISSDSTETTHVPRSPLSLGINGPQIPATENDISLSSIHSTSSHASRTSKSSKHGKKTSHKKRNSFLALISRNWQQISIAAAAFTLGIYVCRKFYGGK